MYKANEDS